MIELSHITKQYTRNSAPAVKDLSFRVEEGSVCGLLGRNGAGKSTTLNILTGCLAPNDGKVIVGTGKDAAELYEEPLKAKAKIGYAPEIPPLYPDMTLFEYLCFAARAKGVSEPRREAERCMKLTATGSYADSLLRTLSKGTRQRVGVAQAILGDPPILILDEPSIGLDPEQIARLRNLIADLGKNHTILLSSHILSEITLLCDHIVLLKEGELAFNGVPEEMLRQTGKSSLEEAFLDLTKGTDEEDEEDEEDTEEAEEESAKEKPAKPRRKNRRGRR